MGRRRLASRRRWWRSGGPAQYQPVREPTRRRPFGEPVQPWWLAESGQRWSADGPAEDRWPSEPARRGWLDALAGRRWYIALARRRWYVALGTGAGIMALASSVIIFQPQHSPGTSMTMCGQVPCTGGLPQVVTPIVAPGAGTITKRRPYSPAPTVSPTPVSAPSTSPASVPSPTASAAAQLPAGVTISYVIVTSWDGGLIATFTITNESSTSITGWQLTADFPGDQIQFAWGDAADPDLGGDILYLQAPYYEPTIAPWTSQTGYFSAVGNSTVPSSCTFDGTACG